MIKDGSVVRVQGYDMKVSEISEKGVNAFGEMVWSFTGHFVDRTHKLCLTSYDGGRYSYRVSDNNIIKP